MTPSENQIFESYVPVYDAVPDSWEEARPFIVEQLKRISNAVNIREIGWFLDEELLSGKAFFPSNNTFDLSGTSQIFRQIFRKVVDFGALPAAGTKAVPHGINVTDNFTLTFMCATATDPVGLISFPIPYAYPLALGNAVDLFMDATNIYITVGIDRSAFTRTLVTIEYMQEV